MQTISWSMSFTTEEKKELLKIVKDHPKWLSRVSGSFGTLCNFNPGLQRCYPLYENLPFISPSFQPWMEKLPEELHIGRKVKVINGTYLGREGVVTDHWQNLDDCSGGYGDHLYQLEGDLERWGCKNNSAAIKVKDCVFIE